MYSLVFSTACRLTESLKIFKVAGLAAFFVLGGVVPGAAMVDPLVSEASLTPADLAAFDTLALREGSLALDGNRLIAGAFGADGNVVDSGSAFIFERDAGSGSWSEVAKLLPNVTPCTSALGFQVANRFGTAVDVDGDRVVVGAPGEDCTGAERDGTVYLFVRGPGGSWTLEQKIPSPVAVDNVGFGSSVALDGDVLVVGAEFQDSDQQPPQTFIGGAALFALSGHDDAENKGSAEFFKFLSSTDIQKFWHKATGYVPITSAAYDAAKAEGYYNEKPQAEIGIKQLSLPSGDNSKGYRMGFYVQIRDVMNREYGRIFAGETDVESAFAVIEEEGNKLLDRFSKTN